MALRSCYECNKEISTKALMCPQCGAPQNPVSGLMGKAKGFLSKSKEAFMSGIEKKRKEKEIEREKEKQEWVRASPAKRKIIIKLVRIRGDDDIMSTEYIEALLVASNYSYELQTKKLMTDDETYFYEILDFEDRLDFDFGGSVSSLKDLEEHNERKKRMD
jgi:hypothetical protein